MASPFDPVQPPPHPAKGTAPRVAARTDRVGRFGTVGPRMNELIALPGEKAGWRVGDVEFVQRFTQGSTPRRFHIQKDQSIVDLYVTLYPGFRNGRIVELGIAAGGSTALLALLTNPTKLVACEVAATPVP